MYLLWRHPSASIHMLSHVCAYYTLLVQAYTPACAHDNADHLGARLAYQNSLSSGISQELINITWEWITPRNRRPPPTKAREAAPSAVNRCPLRRNLRKDSRAVMSTLLYNCEWISRRVREACLHSCIYMAQRKREGWCREVFLSSYLCKPPFWSFLVMNCSGLCSKVQAVKGWFHYLLCEDDKEQSKTVCHRFWIFIQYV